MHHTDEVELNEEFECRDLGKDDILLIAYGSVSLAAKEAVLTLRKNGIKAGLFRPLTLWPSPEKRIKELTQKIDNVLCIELNIRQYTQEVERASQRLDIEGLYKVNGRPISPAEIVDKVKEVF